MEDDDLRTLLGKLTVEEKARLLTGADFWTLHPIPKIGLRRLVLSDGPNGVRGTTWDERDTSLLLPVASGLAATWDRDAVRRAGELFGDEAVRRGVHVVLAPTINLHRSPFGGRHFENFSEDPLLTGVMGAEIVSGIQSRGVAATPKHYVGNESETERLTYNAVIDERTLRDCYLAPFRRIVEQARPWAMMAAYNAVNGHTMTEHSALVNDVLKAEWGFDGVLMSDWFATRSCVAAANGGLDLAMPGPRSPWADGALAKAVEDGEVAEAVLDDKVLRLLRLADRAGAFGEDDAGEKTAVAPPERARSVIRELTGRGFVLLRNENSVLPLDRKVAKVAVIGENASFPAVQGGGSSHVSPPHVVTPLEGIRKALPDAEVQYQRGVRHRRLLDPVPRENLLDPRGEGNGVRVEYLGEKGDVLGTELRGTERLTWQRGAMPEGTTTLRLSGELSAELGEHVLGVNGTGHFRVEVADREVLSADVRSSSEVDDPLADMLAPPEQRFNVVLVDSDVRSGRVRLAIEFTPLKVDADLICVGFGHRPERWDDASELEAALRAARDSDVAVVVVGTNDEVETEGRDRDSLDLPGAQDDLVAKVVAVNPHAVVVVNAGGPVLMPWATDAPTR